MTASIEASRVSTTTVYPVLWAVSIGHLINDTLQSVMLGTYPMLQASLALTYSQIGLITLAFQLTASILQPLIGTMTDRRPMPYILPVSSGPVIGLLTWFLPNIERARRR